MEKNYLIHKLVVNDNTNKLKKYLDILSENNKLHKYINLYNQECKTPLHLAVLNKKQNNAKLLVNYGASTELVDDMGQKVVWYPEQYGGSKIVLGKRYL